ncbi:hypothetical protein Nepgr_007108 [Nepenthes gracilis]|uniref:Protein LURP-one-related 8 n=1 Tax=Nepenthes gracilis TaxID=150966 RepID=A0AAD3S684_NEPGR|nr:hypothetical protein Nepgr_007108 [Nepenthes gracilis]
MDKKTVDPLITSSASKQQAIGWNCFDHVDPLIEDIRSRLRHRILAMKKVYPDATVDAGVSSSAKHSGAASDGDAEVLTVWKKSLLLSCKGFTVFDGKGDLVFRVDNYGDACRGEIVLMDADGKALLTIRRKKLSLGDSWLVYGGETFVNPIFSVRRHSGFLNSKTLAHVCSGNGDGKGCESGSGSGTPPSLHGNKNVVYEIEGSYLQRSVAVYDNKRRCVAEIRKKEAAVGGVALGEDVFRLIVRRPYIDTALAMALVILLDQMFGSSRRLSP